MNKVKGENSRGGQRHTARLDLNYFKRLISTNLGEATEKSERINRKWAMMTEAFFFEQSQGQKQQRRVKIHSWPRLQPKQEVDTNQSG